MLHLTPTDKDLKGKTFFKKRKISCNVMSENYLLPPVHSKTVAVLDKCFKFSDSVMFCWGMGKNFNSPPPWISRNLRA